MKKRTKVVLIVLGVLISVLVIGYIILGFLVGWELMTWQNIKAAIAGLTSSGEELESRQQKSRQDQVDVLKEHGFQISYDDLEKIEADGMSEEEIKDILLGKPSDTSNPETAPPAESEDEKTPSDDDTKTESSETVTVPSDGAGKTEDKKQPDKTQDGKGKSPASTEPTKPSDKASSETKPVQPHQTEIDPVDERTAEIVAQMYVYKSQYSGSIAGIVSAMSSEYYKLPADQQVYSNKVAIYNRYSGQIASMEAQCDAQVYALIDELRALLRANGRDEALADSLASAYETEKENTKAYYVNRYAN